MLGAMLSALSCPDITAPGNCNHPLFPWQHINCQAWLLVSPNLASSGYCHQYLRVYGAWYLMFSILKYYVDVQNIHSIYIYCRYIWASPMLTQYLKHCIYNEPAAYLLYNHTTMSFLWHLIISTYDTDYIQYDTINTQL